jgi:RNA polymerase sigma-70 factor (ECF subfamily)
MLRSRKSRREEPLDIQAPEASADPEREVMLAEGIGLALVVVLETLTPAERVAFVLHDMFAMPFEEIAPIVGRTATATRQLASRARRRVQGSDEPRAGIARNRSIVEAFLAASRGGDFGALISMLDPDVVLRSDEAAVQIGSDRELVGAEPVATTFAGRARAARAALIDGEPGLVWAPGGSPRVVFAFKFERDRIVEIDTIADPERLSAMEIEIL